MSTQRVAIAGATGYAGEELIRILQAHPNVQLTTLAASAKWDRSVPLAEVFPRFASSLNLTVESLDPARFAQSCDVAFLALPHGVSMDIVPLLLEAGCKVIDLGGDFRLKDPQAFAHWYGKPHSHPELLGEAVYGLTELAREAVRAARLIANPGCYATSVILACAPLLSAGFIEPDSITVDAKSGISGAGRKTQAELESAQMQENVWAYKVNSHQHTPEIIQALTSRANGCAPAVCFVPHIVPLHRGILSTIYCTLRQAVSWDDVNACYRGSYEEAPFVTIRPEGQWPKTRDVEGTNGCHIAFTVDPKARRIIMVAVIDNLTKGAAGQAVQNLNVMMGWPETMGLA